MKLNIVEKDGKMHVVIKADTLADKDELYKFNSAAREAMHGDYTLIYAGSKGENDSTKDTEELAFEIAPLEGPAGTAVKERARAEAFTNEKGYEFEM